MAKEENTQPLARSGCAEVTAETVCITPKRALDMGSGPTAEQVQARHVEGESLEANILYFRGGAKGEAWLLVTLDLLYPGAALRQAVEQAAPELSPKQIFVAASHTHRAPACCESMPSLGRVDDDYLDWLKGELTQAIRRAITNPSPERVELWAGETLAQHSINRRLWKRFFLAKKPQWNVIANAPNPQGPTDETISTLEFRTLSGRTIAVLWNYACHPVSHPDHYSYSAHFPAVVRNRLRSYDRKVPVLFFQGFSGDTRPRASTRVRTPKELVRRLFSGPLFDEMSWNSYKIWSESLAAQVEKAVSGSTRIEIGPFLQQRLRVDGERLGRGSRPLWSQSLRLGDELLILGVSGEPVVEYANLVRSWTPARHVFCVGCVDEPAGYLPTDAMILEGGYESDRSRQHFGVGEYAKDYQSTIRQALETVTLRAADEGTDRLA